MPVGIVQSQADPTLVNVRVVTPLVVDVLGVQAAAAVAGIVKLAVTKDPAKAKVPNDFADVVYRPGRA